MPCKKLTIIAIVFLSNYLTAQVAYQSFAENKGYWLVERSVYDGIRIKNGVRHQVNNMTYIINK
jgi:hypothetical protein